MAGACSCRRTPRLRRATCELGSERASARERERDRQSSMFSELRQPPTEAMAFEGRRSLAARRTLQRARAPRLCAKFARLASARRAANCALISARGARMCARKKQVKLRPPRTNSRDTQRASFRWRAAAAAAAESADCFAGRCCERVASADDELRKLGGLLWLCARDVHSAESGPVSPAGLANRAAVSFPRPSASIALSSRLDWPAQRSLPQ